MQSFRMFISTVVAFLLAIAQVNAALGYGGSYSPNAVERRAVEPTPSPVQPNIAVGCSKWRYVQGNDNCDNIVARFAGAPYYLTKSNFLLWNPSLGSKCQGLTLRYYVCVARSAEGVPTPAPVQPGVARNCIKWRYGQGSDNCANIVTRFQGAPYYLTLQKFVSYNPALGTTSNCKVTLRQYYCVQTDPTLPPATTTTTTTRSTTTSFSTPTPIQTGQVNGCIKWRYTQGSDTCANIVTRFSAEFGLTLPKLIQWNPALGPNCENFALRYYLCVGRDGSPIVTTTTRSTTTSFSTPTPIQTGQVNGCIKWRYTQGTDTCANIVTRFSAEFGLTLAKLIQWNPALGPNCENFALRYYVCVGRDGTPIITTTTTTTSMMTTSTTSTTTTTTSRTTTTTTRRPAGTGYWLDEITHQGKAPYAPSGYQVYRNVKAFGARGDGVTDDTTAIQNAIADGARCGNGCDSLTTKPALVYFPPGTYMVSGQIATYYNTHLVGHPVNLPVLKATSNFVGYAIIEGNPYNNGVNWHGPTNNFHKVVRNFVLDTTAMPASSYGTGIHWQVAQATSLNNIVFRANNSPGTKHQGIYMENGSGGYMSDLVFNGGAFGAWMGNQQFTLRNITFNNCDIGIYVAWGWGWNFKSATFNNVRIGIDMSATVSGNNNLNVGSVVVADSRFTNAQIAIASTKSQTTEPETANSLVLDNVVLVNTPIAVGVSGNVKLAGGSTTITMWAQGRTYSQSQQGGAYIQGGFTGWSKPAGLLDSSGKILEKSKPQYANLGVDDILSARSAGCRGDGTSDDTAALQAAINQAAEEERVLYIDYGVYVVTDTIYVPPGSRIMGETWPLIIGSGSKFANSAAPRTIFLVGKPGDSGLVEVTNLVITTRGAMRGAVLIEYNLASPGEVSGLWDVHARVGGFTGSNLEATQCMKTPSSTAVNSNCVGAFMLMKVGSTASRAMFENNWLWTSDHDLDLAAHEQITIFTGRGLLVESTQPIWLYGTASEHNVLYQYQFTNARNVYMGLIQTETPYYQANPIAPTPFTVNSTWYDPDYASICSGNSAATCKKSYGLRIMNSQNILCYGAGLYSFFENYAQTCLDTETCQRFMVSIEGSSNIRLYNVNTKGSETILTVNNQWSAAQGDNRNTFAETVALFQS